MPTGGIITYAYTGGSNGIECTDGSGNISAEYVFFGGKRIAMTNGQTTASIQNGGFENGLTDWTAYGSTTLEDNASNAHSGSYYLQITATEMSFAMNQQIAVQPGEQLTFGGWVNVQSGGGSGCLGWTLAVYDANQNPIAYLPCESPSTSGWALQETAYTVPSNGAYVALYAQVYYPASQTTIWVDDGFISTGTYYYVEDFLGSSRTMVQADGTSPCFDADFLPFGREKDAVAACTQNDYKFEGKERDTETGNDDFGARYYSSNFGRWLSPDWSAIPAPVPYANLTNPQTLNLYAMVQDNPESFADLDGHEGNNNGNSSDNNQDCDLSTGNRCTEHELQFLDSAISGYGTGGLGPMNPDQIFSALEAFLEFYNDQESLDAHTPADPDAAKEQQSQAAQNNVNAQNAQQQNSVTITVVQVQGEGANPAGHVAISVGGGTPIGLVPDSDKAAVGALGKEAASIALGTPMPFGVPGRIEPLAANRKVEATATITVTPGQARAMQTDIQKASSRPQLYDPGYRNCASFVEEVLRSGGVKAPADITPGGLVGDLNKQ